MLPHIIISTLHMYYYTQCPLSQNTLKAECVALVQRNGELEERLAERINRVRSVHARY